MPTDLANFWFGYTLLSIVIALGRVCVKIIYIFSKGYKIPRLFKILRKNEQNEVKGPGLIL